MKFFLPFLIFLLGAALGTFFIYKGIDKHFLSECKTYGPDSTLPQDYINLMNALCSSGFTKIVGAIEIFSGLLLIFPKTRPAGIMFLMPVIITIFLFHLLLDNRPEELIETGVPLLAALIIFISHYKNWKWVFAKRAY
jgi:uncharacterized membrane protein YphA (DoxX/SURF4 family)